MTVGEIIGEGLRLNPDRSGADIRAEVGDWLARVGLERGHATATRTSSPAANVNASASRGR